jgi:hypothetical protein
MAARINHEWAEDYVHESWTSTLPGQRIVPADELLPQELGLSATKSWYPHTFYTKENMDYVGPIPDNSYYGAHAMSDA